MDGGEGGGRGMTVGVGLGELTGGSAVKVAEGLGREGVMAELVAANADAVGLVVAGG